MRTDATSATHCESEPTEISEKTPSQSEKKLRPLKKDETEPAYLQPDGKYMRELFERALLRSHHSEIAPGGQSARQLRLAAFFADLQLLASKEKVSASQGTDCTMPQLCTGHGRQSVKTLFVKESRIPELQLCGAVRIRGGAKEF